MAIYPIKPVLEDEENATRTRENLLSEHRKYIPTWRDSFDWCDILQVGDEIDIIGSTGVNITYQWPVNKAKSS
jgi:hypothetical protein